MVKRKHRSEARIREASKLQALAIRSVDDDALQGFDRRTTVDRLLRDLAPKLSEVLVMRFVGGFSQSEIADTLGIPVGTVKSRVFAGLQQLRTTYSEES